MKIHDIVELSKKELGNDPTGHDFFHAKRVANLAVSLYTKNNSYTEQDIKLLLIMGYLHDIIDDKITNDISTKINEIMELPSIKTLSNAEVEEVFDTIQNMSYSKNLQSNHHLSLKGQYIQDSDRLDALGAIGIARAFAYGGKKGNLIYDPSIQPTPNISKKVYRNKKSTTINHFYEKLLDLSDSMNTSEGKIIAEQRIGYMKSFLNEFFNEWNETTSGKLPLFNE